MPGAPVSDDEDEWLFRPIETTIADHHNLLLAAMQETMQTRYGRLMVFMPPGSAKSTYGSVVAPTWYMGKRPGARIILSSYGSDLARKHGRRARQLVRQDRYRSIFGATVSADTSAADEWAMTNGSEYMAAGLLAGITGNRAEGIIIDDPVRGREAADSAVTRQKTWDAYQDDLLTRAVPGAWMVLIQTRWHEDDLAGRLLPEGYDGRSGIVSCRDGMDWRVINLPAKCERADDPLGRKIGDYLWPEWFDRDHWKPFERQQRTWSALYQQRPSPDDGIYFVREMFRTMPTPPASAMRVYGASDYAVTAGGGDWTVHIVVGIDADGRMHVLDLWRQQASSDAWVEAWCDLVRKWKPLEWAEETGQIRAGVGPFLDRRARERGAYTMRRQFPTRGDKAVRAQSIRGRMAMEGLYASPSAPWWTDLQTECLAFPAGVHDDQVDALGLIGQLLDRILPADKPQEQKKSDTFSDYRAAGWQSDDDVDALTL